VRRFVEDLAFVIDGTPQVHALAGDGNRYLRFPVRVGTKD
jgi:hypothetical protein